MEPHICTHSHVIPSDRSEAGNNTTEVDVMQRDIEQLAQQETALLARPKEFILDPKFILPPSAEPKGKSSCQYN